MTHFNHEKLAELNRQRIFKDMEEIRLQEEALRGKNAFSRMLALLGAWMVARGQKLRQNNSAPQEYYSELRRIAHR